MTLIAKMCILAHNGYIDLVGKNYLMWKEARRTRSTKAKAMKRIEATPRLLVK